MLYRGYGPERILERWGQSFFPEWQISTRSHGNSGLPFSPREICDFEVRNVCGIAFRNREYYWVFMIVEAVFDALIHRVAFC